MATGRMIVNAICADKRINLLSDDTSRLAFTWLITFADREGRTYGDPGVVRSMLFPRRQDVTIEQMESYIAEWRDLGLIVWYEADGDKWIYFPNFEKNQPGMRKEKEAPSRVPCPPSVPITSSLENTNSVASPPLLRTGDAITPPLVPFKRINKKRINKNGIEDSAAKSAAPGVSIPTCLDCPEFKTAWDEWLDYRTQTRHKETPITQRKQLAQLEKFQPTTAIAMINQSITNGWQGIYELKSNGNNHKTGNLPIVKEDPKERAKIDAAFKE